MPLLLLLLLLLRSSTKSGLVPSSAWLESLSFRKRYLVARWFEVEKRFEYEKQQHNERSE